MDRHADLVIAAILEPDTERGRLVEVPLLLEVDYDAHRLGPDDPSLVPYRFQSGMLNSAAHFAFTYGAGRAWLVLLVIMFLGVLARLFFNLRHQGRTLWAIPAE